MKLPFNKFGVLAVLWFAAGVYSLILREADGGVPPFPHFDKFAHFCLFLAQVWLCAKAFMAAGRPVPYRGLLAFALIYAVGSEWAQAVLTQTRQGSFWDGVADMCGALLALHFARKGVAAVRVRNPF